MASAEVQDLLFHFFKQMNLLSSMPGTEIWDPSFRMSARHRSLLLQQKENGVTVAWKSRPRHVMRETFAPRNGRGVGNRRRRKDPAPWSQAAIRAVGEPSDGRWRVGLLVSIRRNGSSSSW